MKTINFVLIATVCFGRIAFAGPGMSSEAPKLKISQKKLHEMLISAIQEYDCNKVDLIIKHSNERLVNKADQIGLTPLHHAVLLDNKWLKYFIVKSLVLAGANSSEEDCYGDSAHEMAIAYNNKVLGSNSSTNIEILVTKAVLDALGVEKNIEFDNSIVGI